MSYRLAEEIDTNSCVFQEYLNGVIRVGRDASAGYSLADLVYMAMACVLISLRATLVDSGLQSSISVGSPSMVAYSTSFVVYVAQPVLGPATTLLQNIALTTTECFEVFSCGRNPLQSRSKSEKA